MYRFENINYISDNIIISKSQKINSIENIDLIKSMKEKIFINTGKQILKEILDINKKFIHIHPGDLPLILEGLMHLCGNLKILEIMR